MLRKPRSKDDLKGRCSLIQVILLMAMMLFLALPQGGKSVSVDRIIDSQEAEYQDAHVTLTYELGF